MKLYIIIIFLTFDINCLFGQTAVDSVRKANSAITITSHDSANTQQDTVEKEYIRKVNIKVNREEPKDASIFIIRTSKITFAPNMERIEPIQPDTLGKFDSPVSINLYSGDYDIVATKTGFRNELERIRVGESFKNNIQINMFSLDYLNYKRKQWNTTKWISAAVAVGAGIASYYFDQRINTLRNEYVNAYTTGVIQDKRDAISKNQQYYKICSTIGFAAFAGFGISWMIEISY